MRLLLNAREQPREDIAAVEENLGWHLMQVNGSKIGRVLAEERSRAIVELKGNERVYCLTGFPALSRQESEVLGNALREFQSEGEKADKRGTYKFLKAYCIENLLELDSEQKNYFLELLNSMVFGFGPMDCLLGDPEIEEIALIGLGRNKPVHVFHRRFGWLQCNLYYAKQETVVNLVNSMASALGRRLSAQKPVLNASLPNGNRLHAAIRPVSVSGPTLTVRKFRKEPFTPLDLISNKTFGSDFAAFVWLAMQLDCSFIVAGNTGSGKTTTLNSLFSFVPKQERIVVVEETPEIMLPHTHQVKLNVVSEQGIGMRDLITSTLRMRPDRVVVGELRDREEVAAFIDTLLAGQGKGSYATFHAQSTAEALKRLRNLGVMEMDIAAIDFIVVQKRWNRAADSALHETRRVVELCEVIEKNEKPAINTVFGFDFGKDRLVKRNASERVVGKAEKCFNMGRPGIRKEVCRRERLLDELAGKEIGLDAFFELLNSGSVLR